MKKIACLIVLVLGSVIGVGGQYKRPNVEIATELDRLAAELRLPDAPPVVTTNLQTALSAAPVGSTLQLSGEFTGNFITNGVSITGGRIFSPNGSPALIVRGDRVSIRETFFGSAAGASTNDLVILGGTNITLTNVEVMGNGNTKRGITAIGVGMTLERVNVHHIGRRGQESQALAMWDGSGLTVRNSTLIAGSTSILIGGNDPAVPNTIPSDITIEDNLLSHHLEWRGQGYVNKTGFELKSARRVVFRRNIVENVWVDGQTAWGITLTPVNQGGNSPETIVEDVLIANNTIRNVGGGANVLGFTQETTRPTLQLRNITFQDNTFTISRAQFGGHGSLMQLGLQPLNLRWTGNTVTQDGEAFIRTSDSRAISGFVFLSNTVTIAGPLAANIYGIWTPIGSRGGTWVQTVFPGIELTSNTFIGSHSIFRTWFPNNIYQ